MMSSPAEARLCNEISTVIDVVERRAIGFMCEEIELNAPTISRRMDRADQFDLRAVTAIIGVGASAGLYIAFTYDDALIRMIMRRYTAELTVAPEDEDLYVRETASDIVNVIVGNCTADLATRGGTITLSPPVLVEGARTIKGRPEATVAVHTIAFDDGELDIAFVGPKALFDERLNYTGEAA
ncbi:MAG: chemotaxis protein CheX [Maricaulaceae bacterium]|jgi:CheY-specific phosphatase CheX